MTEITVTYLEMSSLAELKPRLSPDPRFIIREAIVRQWRLNRFLYSLVGEDWTWTDKRSWTDEQWQSYVNSDDLRTFVASFEGSIAGYYEIHRDAAQAIEIIYFGLAPEFIGRGFGGAMLTDAIERAWAWNARRVWVHTCSLDHPAAIPNYQARGMTIYDRQLEQVSQALSSHAPG
jgi:GNAT superfamily N-acetyltransferase